MSSKRPVHKHYCRLVSCRVYAVRRPHNPEVVGSNPAPATNYSQTLRGLFSYRGATMTLENKLGITDPIVLAHEEERISKAEALGMLFGGLYEFAGKIRTVNLAKGGFRFAPALYLAQALRAVEAMPQGTFDQVAEKYVEMNVAHPFREGNGRSGRIWLDHMLRVELGRTVDWSVIPREDYLLAMERSPVRDVELKALLSDALSDRLDDAALLARSVDASYAYEGYAAYRAGEL